MTTQPDTALERIPISPIPAVNVAVVPQRSPLRYPGGKTWLIPHIRAWLSSLNPKPQLLAEPFAGGAIASLTAVMENMTSRSLMAEIDPEVAAFWQAVLNHSDELIDRIQRFIPTRESIAQLVYDGADDIVSRGFRTLALNRARHGGILAHGAALTRIGESGKGVASRWYPETIIRRIRAIADYAGRIDFRHADGLEIIEQLPAGLQSRTAIFADPPYTAAGKQAGNRLYNHNSLDHSGLFHRLAQSEADFLMTYDQSPEIIELTRSYGFHAKRVQMKNTHHAQIWELVITRRPAF